MVDGCFDDCAWRGWVVFVWDVFDDGWVEVSCRGVAEEVVEPVYGRDIFCDFVRDDFDSRHSVVECNDFDDDWVRQCRVDYV